MMNFLNNKTFESVKQPHIITGAFNETLPHIKSLVDQTNKIQSKEEDNIDNLERIA